MKPTREIFEVTEDLVIIIDNKTNLVTLQAGNQDAIAFTFDIANELTSVLSGVGGPKTPERFKVMDPAIRPVPAAAGAEYAQAVGTITGDMERNNAVALTNALAHLYVLERGGKYLSRTVPFGQEVGCDGPIELARMIEDPAEAAALAQRLHAAVVPASTVVKYKIAVKLADGGIRFWVGNGQPLSDHVNNSTTITGFEPANQLLSTVIVPDTQTKFLLPTTA